MSSLTHKNKRSFYMFNTITKNNRKEVFSMSNTLTKNNRKEISLMSNTLTNYKTRFLISPRMADEIIFNSDITLPAPYQYKRITLGDRSIASKMYEAYFNRRKASENNPNFYDPKNRDYYIIYKNKEFINGVWNFNKNAVAIGKAILKVLNLIRKIPQDWNRPDRIILPKFNKIYDSVKPKKSNLSSTHKQSSGCPQNKPLLREKNTTKTKHYSNTRVNTKRTNQKPSFKPMSTISAWMDNAKKLGLTIDTIDKIAKFSNTYSKSAYKVTGLIKEARDAVANKHHISKKIRGFETNGNIVARLGSKVYKLFTYIVNPKYHGASLNNYAGFIVNSLKTFFKWCFGLIAPTVVTPKTKTVQPKIKHKLPKWAQKGYHVKLHPTSPKLQAKIKKQLKGLGEE